MARRTVRKSALPYRQFLLELAKRLETDSISEAERKTIAHLLRALAEGQSVDEALNIVPTAHRPRTMDAFQRAWDVAILSQPECHRGGGFTVTAAIDEVAAAHGVSRATIEDAWKSWEGRAIRDFVRREHVDPVHLPLPD